MTTQTLTLTDFLLARLAEDEAAARAAGGEWWLTGRVPGPTMRRSVDQPTEVVIDSPSSLIAGFVAHGAFAEHITRFDPARVLAECEAKRNVVEMLSDSLSRPIDERAEWVLQALALPYADHPDYREDWAL